MVLACFNQHCYNGKLKAGAAEYREKLEDHKKVIFQQDREMSQMFYRGLEAIDPDSLRALATVLMARTDKLELQHPFGEFVGDWSYERGDSRAREVLGLELRRGLNYLGNDGMRALQRVAPGDLRELVVNLMTHHLRLSGELDSAPVSQETADAAA